MGTDRDSDVGMLQRAAIQRYPLEAQKLPQDGEWLREDIDLHFGALNVFSRNGVVTKVREDPRQDKRHFWTTTPGVVEWVENHTSEPSTPCGHATGIRTIEAGTTFTCTDDSCDCRMSRAEAEEVIA